MFMTTSALRFVLLAAIVLEVSSSARKESSSDVKLTVTEDEVVLNNGIVRLTLANPTGGVTGIQYAGIDNMLEPRIPARRRGYWDVNWKGPDDPHNIATSDLIEGENMYVVTNTPEQVEVSFTSRWTLKDRNSSTIPMNFDIRYILQKGKSGYYTYGIYRRPLGFPPCDLIQTRVVFRLNGKMFNHMRMSDKKGRLMPTIADIGSSRSDHLEYQEAVQIVRPTNPAFKNEVDDKYQYSEENENAGVYGWHGSNTGAGFWMMFPSHEFRSGGPTKQSLTVQTGPICLAMFHSGHYMSNNTCSFESDEKWKKVFGPVYIHFNQDTGSNAAASLWDDAKKQRLKEMANWPYSFVASPHFVKTQDRASIEGKFFIFDRYLNSQPFPAKAGYVGLVDANSGKPSWQVESKGYQFWGRTDDTGSFKIKNILPGKYTLWGWVPGILGEYQRHQTLVIIPGSSTNLHRVIFEPPRIGPTLWEIGVPDRTAAEFYIPSPLPQFINKLFLKMQKFRQYGLWERYPDVFPKSDPIFKVGVSSYTKDWFYAHVTRRTANGEFVPTIWQVVFSLKSVDTNGSYMLRVAIAASNYGHFEVRFNDHRQSTRPHYQTSLAGRDNAIARHGIHGLYQLLSIRVEPSWLCAGTNTVYFRQANAGLFNGFMYDYVRFEAKASGTA